MNQQQLQALVEQISMELFERPFCHEARFNNRLRTTGGRYLLKTHDIEINPKQLEVYGLDEVIGVVKHELCHYHLHLQGKGYQHRDQDFKQLMQKVGAPRHCKAAAPMNQSAGYKHFYQCKSCGASYRRKRKVNIERYSCGVCRGRLKKLLKDG